MLICCVVFLAYQYILLPSCQSRELDDYKADSTVVSSEEVKLDIPVDFNKLKKVNKDIYAWIVVPGTLANGNVIDISLITIKVQNFDNTIVTVPSYSLVSSSFQNWRGMDESGGRRMTININLDMDYVHFCTPDEL